MESIVSQCAFLIFISSTYFSVSLSSVIVVGMGIVRTQEGGEGKDEYKRQYVVEANHKLNRLFGASEGKRVKRHASLT